jgi:hypothetical protein
MFPLHLVLIPIIPLLLLVSHNVDIVSLQDVFLPFLILVSVAIFFQATISRFFKSKAKVALVISWFYILFFSYGHIHGYLNQIMGSSILELAVQNRYLVPIFGILFLLGSFCVLKIKKILDVLTKFVNVWAVVMVSILLFNIVSYVISGFLQQEKILGLEIEPKDIEISKSLPDIYYINFDAYANEHTLKETFEYDNGPFLNSLKDRGFYVASKSSSNYAETLLSLGSSLNMDYLDQKILKGPRSNNHHDTDLMKSIENGKVILLLKSRGYKFVHLAAGWGVALKNRNADLEIKCDQINEVISTLVASSLYFPFEKHFKLISNDRRQQILCTFEEFGKTSSIPGPKFVFGHVLLPHFPFDFGPNGEDVDHEDTKEKYLGQLIFANNKIITMVDKILESNSSPPIIIIQSDHGPSTPFTRKPFNGDVQFKRDRMRNLNAYLLPGRDGEILYETISPVNTFRVIFNLYFNADYKLLEDKSYFSWYPKGSYHLEEIAPYTGSKS